MLTPDQARAIGEEWHSGPDSQLYRFARTSIVGCRRRILAEIRAAHRECVAVAAMYGPVMIDSPEPMDETARRESHDEAVRLLALADWTEARDEACASPEDCVCSSRPADVGQH